MQAVVMAGGKGTRLGPYTAVFPKPLMPVGDKPILEILLRQLKKAGVKEVILTVNHLSHLIQSFFGAGEELGIRLTYFKEDKPLGTAGSLGQIRSLLDENFFVLNGDLLTTLNFKGVMQQHINTGADGTVSVYRRDIKSEFGVLDTDNDKNILQYREKPIVSHLVSMGFYAFSKRAIEYIELDQYLDMPQFILRLIEKEKMVKCYQEDCYWLDIGRPEDYSQAQIEIEQNPELFWSEK